MSVLGAIWVTVAVAFIASAVYVVWLADRAPAGEPDRSQLDEWDEFTRDRDRERFERMIHPSNSDLAAFEQQMDRLYGRGAS